MAKTKSAESVLAMFKDKDVKYVDLRFTDPRGKMQHLTMDVALINEDAFADGIMFDGSSIAGWKVINEFGHDADARSRVRAHRPVLCPDHRGAVLRYSRSGHRRGL